MIIIWIFILETELISLSVSAIKSLDQLNDQIVQFIFSPKVTDLDLENDLSAEDRQALHNSMTLMRKLLLDAQAKFRKMVGVFKIAM